jgi:hypothetical protein
MNFSISRTKIAFKVMRLRVIGYLKVICFLTPKIKALKFFIFINWRRNKLELKRDVKAAPDNKGRVFFTQNKTRKDANCF